MADVYVIDTKINLCDSCIHDVPTCDADCDDIEYGDGFGNDNIIKCRLYVTDLMGGEPHE